MSRGYRIPSAGALLALLLASPAMAAPAAPSPAPLAVLLAAADKVMPDVPTPPSAVTPAPGGEDAAPDSGEDDGAPVTGKDPDAPAPSAAAPAPDQPVPTVEYDFSKLPPPVKRLRDQIIAAASTGDPEKLRPIIEGNGDEPPQLSLNDIGDPIDYLKSLSGDKEGREILAILIQVLEAGYVHVDVGTPDEMYVWPYFARYPVDKLTPPQIVELFKIVYAGDYEDMKTYGQYLSYRIGIAPNGVWKYFLTGD